MFNYIFERRSLQTVPDTRIHWTSRLNANSDSVGLAWGRPFCYTDQLSGDANALRPEITLEGERSSFDSKAHIRIIQDAFVPFPEPHTQGSNLIDLIGQKWNFSINAFLNHHGSFLGSQI